MAFNSPNFGFLQQHDDALVRYAAQAERYFADDPNTSLIKLRQFVELLAEHATAYAGVWTMEGEGRLFEVIQALYDRGAVDGQIASIFHTVRKAGNDAVHEGGGTHRDALRQLKLARRLAIWFHTSFGTDATFKPGPFVPPPDPAKPAKGPLLAAESPPTTYPAPSDVDDALLEMLAELRAELAKQRETSEHTNNLLLEAQADAAAAYAELETALELAEESEAQLKAQRTRFQAKLQSVQAQTMSQSADAQQAIITQAQAAAVQVSHHLDERETRTLIDAQLVAAGWEADTEVLRYSKGVRPAKGKTQAIAEWPTASGPADYVLFVGLNPIAVVEAKRAAVNVQGRVGQAERYSKTYEFTKKRGDEPIGGPWDDDQFHVPFVFATNGRPYLRQHLAGSGIWFRDVRRPTNVSRAVEGWYSPDGLQALLKHDQEEAEKALADEPFDYLPWLRDYQREAITSVEAAITAGDREMLLAMATGTGKTRTAIALVYRLIKTGRFNRVLFLVDRTSLGEQAYEGFEAVKLEQLKSFTEIYDVKQLGDIKPDTTTKLHFSTVQGMVRRVLRLDEDDDEVTVDQYDCIVVDECHRGYSLDRELSDMELTFRSEHDYISKYRRVLDHFDAVKVGLTATPALHTTQIFGDPVFTYSYRRAVIEGHLVDHEPPIRILTERGETGFKRKKGDELIILKTRTNQLDLVHAPDDVHIEIEGFNTKVITEGFNRVVCQQLAKDIDPDLPGKTLIFCATDQHADMVVRLLKEAFENQYGSIDNEAVQKITGNAHKPGQRIRNYKNERNPVVAVTVDLLTTGINVPEISNLVFIRRVRSRILYEQMLGRATRKCDEIGKEAFKIYDAVDLYAALQDYTDMRPVVRNPSISFTQLVDELQTETNAEVLDDVLDQLIAKLQRKKGRMNADDRQRFVTLAGMTAAELLLEMPKWGATKTGAWFKEHPELPRWLDRSKQGDGRKVIIDPDADHSLGTQRGYGDRYERPEDYLEGFGKYIAEHMNDIPALMLVTQRPRELTRQQLRELKMALDEAGFTEAGLRVAYAQATNQEIAATIIGFIRQQALGSALVPYEKRVEAAMERILSSRAWTTPQRKWLERIGKQLEQETVVDRAALDAGQFKAKGGFDRLNKVFDGQLDQVLGEINEELWKDAAG